MTNFTAQCDDYLASRTGKYEWRSVRYARAARAIFDSGRNWGKALKTYTETIGASND